jgi:hypothetical protein
MIEAGSKRVFSTSQPILENTRSRVALYLVGVFSRRIMRSTHANNRVINELWDRVQKIRGPSQAILQQSLVCSDLLVNEMLLKSKGPALLNSDTRRTTEEHFRRLHNILLVYFVFRFQAKYPTLCEDLRAALVDVVDARTLAHDVFDKCLIRSASPAEPTPLGELRIAKCRPSESEGQHSGESTRSNGNQGLSNTAVGLIWRKVTIAIGAGNPENLEQVAWFAVIVSRLYSSAEERIEAKFRAGAGLLWRQFQAVL